MRNYSREEGQGLVEYALILVLVAIVVIAILSLLGPAINVVFARVMGGFYGQSLSGQGREAIVLADAEVVGSTSCQITLPAGTQVFFMEDGALVTDQSPILLNVYLGNDPATPPISVKVSGTGVGELENPEQRIAVCGGGVRYDW